MQFCPSCSSKKVDDSNFCPSCGFDFSLINSSETFDSKFTYFLRIHDKSILKYRTMTFFDDHSNVLVNFKSKFIFFGFKFKAFNSESKFISVFDSGINVNNISLYSAPEETNYTLNYDYTTNMYKILDRNGHVISSYSCSLIQEESFELFNTVTGNRIQLIKMDNNNPRNIKISSKYEIHNTLDQIILTVIYFVLSYHQRYTKLALEIPETGI